MDLSYLHLLQDFREMTGDAFTPFFDEVALFVSSAWPTMFFAFIYWVVKKRDGFIFLLGASLTILINAVVKLTVCVYRPWVRDPSIVPAGNSQKGATGYSFPSGHASKYTYYFGSVAQWLWGKCRVLSYVCFVVILIGCFGRNYQGVHTPQDVIVGMIIGVIGVFLAPIIYKKMETCKANRDIVWLLLTFALCGAILLYINIKPYPMDYVDGTLLVDPVTMTPDCYLPIGMLLAFVVSWVVDRRFIKYECCTNNKYAILIAFVLAIPIYYWMSFSVSMLTPIITKCWAKFIEGLVMYAYILMFVPLILKAVGSRATLKPSVNKQ